MSIVATLCALTASAQADEGPSVLLGWAANGDFIVKGEKPSALMACTPTTIKTDDSEETISCEVCEGDACKIATPARLTSSMVSPDGNVRLAAGRACHTGHDYQAICASSVVVDLAGVLGYVGDEGSRAKPRIDVWFRPDSRAVMVRFPTAFYVIDVAAVAGRRASAVAEARGLLDKHVEALKVGGDPATAPDAQFYVDDVARGAIAAAALGRAIGLTPETTIDNVTVTRSASGNAAWIVFDAKAAEIWHATELAVRTKGGWRIASGMWSRGTKPDDRELPAPARVAQNRQDVPLALSVPGALLRDGDPELVAHFDVKRAAGADKQWRAWLTDGIRSDGVHGALVPDEPTGWMIANVELQQKRSDGSTRWVPQRAWLVFDGAGFGAKDDSPTIVLAHVAPLRQ